MAGGRIRDTDARFGSLLQRNPLPIAVVDRERRVLFVNPAFERLYGYSEAEVLGRSITEMIGLPDGAEEARQLAHQTLSGASAHIVTRRRRKDRAIVDVEMHILPLEVEGLPDATIGIYRDLTEERRAQAEVSHFFNLSLDLLCICGFDERLQRVNASFQRVLGHPESALVGGHVLQWVHPDDRAETQTILASLRRGETINGFENRWRGADGQYKWIQWAATPVMDAATIYAVGRDTTVQHLVTQQLREAVQMKADFVSFVTHQLRTPLAGIKWMLELSADAADREESESYIRDARESADRLIALVNDLLDASRLENNRLQVTLAPVDVQALTESVLGDVETLVQDRGHDLQVTVEADPPVVAADEQLLRQVILNLVSNAVKYTPPGGRVRIRIGTADGSLVWEVEDSGIGIPEAARARLFEKFFRAENAVSIDTEGTGLGLYLARLIVERFGGHVACDSVVGRGSTFRFTMPTAVAHENS